MQLPLIPSPRPARTLREHVLAMLHGFELRQAARQEKRQQQNRNRGRYQLKPIVKPKPKEPHNAMRIYFRATFAGPNEKFNAGFRMPATLEVTVELYRQRENWYAKVYKGKQSLSQVGTSVNYGVLKDSVAECFSRQLTPWTMHDVDGMRIDPDTVQEDPNGNFTLKEITHVGAEGQGAQAGNQFSTVCGLQVHARQIRSRRGKTAPTCKYCRLEWDKIKPEERIA